MSPTPAVAGSTYSVGVAPGSRRRFVPRAVLQVVFLAATIAAGCGRGVVAPRARALASAPRRDAARTGAARTSHPPSQDTLPSWYSSEPSAYDSHPRARDRIAWTAGIPPAGSLELDDDRPVWSLFADRDALEREMTDQLRLVVAERNGVTIPSEDAREGAREDAVA